MAYQIVDVIADANATEAQTGKTAGQDVKNRKATYVTVLGLADAREKALQYLASARESVLALDSGADFLTGLVDLLAEKARS